MLVRIYSNQRNKFKVHEAEGKYFFKLISQCLCPVRWNYTKFQKYMYVLYFQNVCIRYTALIVILAYRHMIRTSENSKSCIVAGVIWWIHKVNQTHPQAKKYENQSTKNTEVIIWDVISNDYINIQLLFFNISNWNRIGFSSNW